jgi:hypothetical protein
MKRIWTVLLIFTLFFASVPAFAEGEEIYINAYYTSDEYKDMLMDSFDQTVLGQNVNVREQLKKILYNDAVTVDAAAYNLIMSSVQKAVDSSSLSPGASLESYTNEDLAIAVGLIANICSALDLDFAIDPSNDSQNEYARVITIRKDGKVLGMINSDAKTDVASSVSPIWLIIGGILLIAAVWIGIWQLAGKRSLLA